MLLRLVCIFLVCAGAASAQGRREVQVTAPASSSEATFEVCVEIDVVEGPYREPVPVSGAVVELGVGWGEEEASAFWALPVLARVTADEQGRIRETLAVPERWLERESACIWARVEMPGRTRRAVARQVPNKADSEPLLLRIYRGGTVTGTVIDGAGEPVAQADVGLYRRHSSTLELWRSGLADSAGRFALNYAKAGVHDVQARDARLGTGEEGSLALDFETRNELLEITLVGGVSLAGRVLDPDGYPVPGLTVTVVPRGGLPDELGRSRARAGGGLLSGRAVTDRRGRFELSNLVAGEYAVYGDYQGVRLPRRTLERRMRMRARVGSTRSSKPAKTPRGTLMGTHTAPSTAPEDFILHARRLEVTVVDHVGRRVDPTAALLAYYEDTPGAPELRLSERNYFWSGMAPIQFDELVVYAVEPDKQYVLSWRDEALSLAELSIDVDWSQARIPLELRLGPPGEPARLTVRVLGPGGELYPDDWSVNAAMLFLCSAKTGREVATTVRIGRGPPPEFSDSTWQHTLQRGRYRVELSAPSGQGCGITLPFPRTPLLPVSAEVELASGEGRTLDLHLEPGGHLDFEPLTPRPAMTPAETRALTPNNTITLALIEATRIRLSAARAVLTSRTGDRTEVPLFDVQGPNDLRSHGLPWVIRGWPARGLSPIAPGDWTLRLERDGDLLLERQVTIVAGEVTTVRW